MQTLALGLTQANEDLQQAATDADIAYGRNGMKSVLLSQQQRDEAAKRAAQFGEQMAMAAATVYHGSPHKFNKFDSSKIGTGEGAQAYGHGLYLAEAKKVADEYAGKLSSKNVTIPGFSPSNSAENELLTALTARANSTQYGSAASAVMNDLWSVARHGDPTRKAAAQRMLDAMGNAGMPSILDAGSLYKVDLPDPLIARMLDWDKPLSQQAPEVRGLLSGHDGSSLGSEIYNRYKAGDVPQLLPDRFSILDPQTGIYASSNATSVDEAIKLAGGDPQKVRIIKSPVPSQTRSQSLQGPAAEQLRSLGIPGIRYLDGGSRADGAGTSNFVVFPGEESALTILERNGKPVRNNATTSSEGLPMSKIDLSRIPGAAEADNAVREIERLAEQHGTVYIRWSAGTGHDLKPGANSRDSVSGSSHAGLSAIPISGDMHPVDIAKRLAEYGFLRMKDKGIRPRVYVGEQIGTDSDGYALIRPSSEVAKVSDETVRAIDSGYAKAAELRDRIDELSARLPKLQGSGRDITERNLAKARGELDQLLSSIKK